MSRPLLVVVAEDYLPLRLCVCELLLAMGAQVLEATNATELSALLDEQVVDVVVTDVRMAGTSGLDVLARRRACGDRTPFVVMSGAMVNVEARLAGCDGVVPLEKPFTEPQLREAIERAVALGPA